MYIISQDGKLYSVLSSVHHYFVVRHVTLEQATAIVRELNVLHR